MMIVVRSLDLPPLLAALLLACASVISAQTQTPGRGTTATSVSVSARAIQPGELVLLKIATREKTQSVRVTGMGREFPTFSEGATEWRALVGIDLDVKPGRYDLSVVAGDAAADQTTYRLVVAGKKFATRQLTVDPAFVNPPAEAQVRIQTDAERLTRVWAASSPVRLWSGAFVRPVTAPANSAFGTRSVFNGEPRSPHGGADFSSPAGTPVASPNAGRVVVAADLYFTGNTVVIDHGLGLFSLFAHLQSMDVKEGDTVVTSLVLGKVGATGRVTGPHLHWTVRVNDARVDPMSLLVALGQATRNQTTSTLRTPSRRPVS
jgi:murein DD-endopeptidase MepM/ murein hydrolase activator NlpD